MQEPNYAQDNRLFLVLFPSIRCDEQPEAQHAGHRVSLLLRK